MTATYFQLKVYCISRGWLPKVFYMETLLVNLLKDILPRAPAPVNEEMSAKCRGGRNLFPSYPVVL